VKGMRTNKKVSIITETLKSADKLDPDKGTMLDENNIL